MINDYIIDKIKEWLKKNALGKVNAKPRAELLEYVIYGLHYDISDRALRRTYASFNHVGYSSKGIYWIDDAADLRNFKDRQQGRAVAIFTRTKKTEIEIEGVRQPGLF
jgi:hypothetical protein